MEHVEKFYSKQQQEYAFKNRLSRFRIHLTMKRPPNRQYYGAESYTLARVLRRRLQLVPFSGHRGLNNCLTIEKRLRGRYQKATIYMRQGQQWQEVISFADGQAPVHKHPAALQPPPVVHMRVVHNNLDGSVSFLKAA